MASNLKLTRCLFQKIRLIGCKIKFYVPPRCELTSNNAIMQVSAFRQSVLMMIMILEPAYEILNYSTSNIEE